MIYAGIDVDVITHEKALNSGLTAFGLWCWGMCYAQKHTTDGRLPKVAVMSALDEERRVLRRAAVRLVTSGLWLESSDGSYQVHNYGKKNQTVEEIERRKTAARERKERWRERQEMGSGTRSNSVPERVRNDPSPSPDNTTSTITKITEHTAPAEPSPISTRRGSRLPEGWRPSDETQAWARAQGIADPLGQLDEFADFWRAQPGSRGVKLDWDATYRNRLRQVGNGKGARLAARGAEITKQGYDPEAPWMKLPEVG